METEIVCDERESSCRCYLPLNHEGPHKCKCAGSWLWLDGEFKCYELPEYGARLKRFLFNDPIMDAINKIGHCEIHNILFIKLDYDQTCPKCKEEIHNPTYEELK